MRRQNGFTISEMVVVVCVVLLAGFLVAVLLPRFDGGSRPAYRTVCAANLIGIYKTMYTYSITNSFMFPIAGLSKSSVTGFHEGSRATGAGALFDDNATASLWMVVRDGSVNAKSMVCPLSDDVVDPLVDSSGAPAALDHTFDFLARKNLSYSTINMFHKTMRMNWSANAPSDFVLMSDNNANDSPGSPARHTLTKGAHQADVEAAENSPNHGGDGQNFMYGDGHVAYSKDPFVGRHGDNAFAMVRGGLNVPPTLGNSDGDAATDPKLVETDSVLIPVSGNGGGADSISGKALDVKGRSE